MLIDFGLAQKTDIKDRSVVGTFLYAPPEQTGMLKRPVDGRSDLYALGVLLFELLCGTLPFAGNDPVTMCKHQLYTKPPSLGDRLPVNSTLSLINAT